MPDFNDIQNAPDELNSLGDASRHASEGLGSMALKAEGAVAVLQDLGAVLDQIAKNPLASGYALGAIGNKIRDYITNELRNVNKYTEEEVRILKRVADQLPGIMKVSGAIASIGLNAAESYKQLLKVTVELGKFTAFTNLPGGTTDRFRAGQVMLGENIKTTLDLNAGIAKLKQAQYENIKAYFAPGTNDAMIQQMARHFAVYTNAFGGRFDPGETLRRLRTSMPAVGTQFLGDRLRQMMGMALFSNALGVGQPAENMQYMLRGIESIQENTQLPGEEAINMGMRLFPLVKSLSTAQGPIGNEQAIRFIDMLSKMMSSGTERLTQQAFGVDVKSALQNPEGFAKFIGGMRRFTGGYTSYMNMPAEKQVYLSEIGQRIGYSMKELFDVAKLTEFYDNVGKVSKSLKTFENSVEGLNGQIENQYRTQEQQERSTKGIGDAFEGLLNGIKYINNEFMHFSGIKPLDMEVLSLQFLTTSLFRGIGGALPVALQKFGQAWTTAPGTILPNGMIAGAEQGLTNLPGALTAAGASTMSKTVGGSAWKNLIRPYGAGATGFTIITPTLINTGMAIAEGQGTAGIVKEAAKGVVSGGFGAAGGLYGGTPGALLGQIIGDSFINWIDEISKGTTPSTYERFPLGSKYNPVNWRKPSLGGEGWGFGTEFSSVLAEAGLGKAATAAEMLSQLGGDTSLGTVNIIVTSGDTNKPLGVGVLPIRPSDTGNVMTLDIELGGVREIYR